MGEACTHVYEASTGAEVGGQRGRRRLDGHSAAQLGDTNAAHKAPIWLGGMSCPGRSGGSQPRGLSRVPPNRHTPELVCSTQVPMGTSMGCWAPLSPLRPGDGDITADTGLGNTVGLGSSQCTPVTLNIQTTRYWYILCIHLPFYLYRRPRTSA